MQQQVGLRRLDQALQVQAVADVEPVRQVGSYQVSARLHPRVTATVTIEVRALGGA